MKSLKTKKKIAKSSTYGKTPSQFSTRFASAIEHAHALAGTLSTMSEEEIKLFGVLGTLNATFAENKVPYALLRTYRKAERPASWGAKKEEAKP